MSAFDTENTRMGVFEISDQQSDLFKQQPRKSNTIHFVERANRFLAQYAQPSRSELSDFPQVLQQLRFPIGELFEVNEIDEVISELYRLAKNSPMLWILVKQLANNLETPIDVTVGKEKNLLIRT